MQNKENSFFDNLEENFIAITLGLMTIVTFANVIARYIFNDNILWGLEVTVFLFAWLVLIGSAYGVKKNFHIGVDVAVNYLPEYGRKVAALFACAACLLFAALIFVGAWNYWAPFAGVRPLPILYNDWIASPLGLTEFEYRWRSQAFYETDDVPVPFFLGWISDAFNEGETYEKLPRFIPYLALPIGMGLLLFRFIQATGRVIRNEQHALIASHEADELMEEMEAQLQADESAK